MDVLYNDEVWIRNVQATVTGIVTAKHPRLHQTPKVGLIGHSKDNSSYYLSLFPQWQGVNVANYQGINATQIRESLLANPEQQVIADKIPQPAHDVLNAACDTSAFAALIEEYAFIHNYQQRWATAPYTPTFVTVDAVVVQSGHLLLVKRRARPGKGLYALPGGFVEQTETLKDACLRELKEETRIKVPVPVLRGNIRKQRTFDDPYRSSRGRTISTAFHIELPAESALPKVKGSDDADHAFWLPLADLNPETLFEDHYFIIQAILGLQ
jgi:bifunctional NMN adenylyltransferase/nudix hydrolase